MNLQPLGARVVVELIEDPKQSKGGILLPDVAAKRPERGRVIAVGPGDDEAKPQVASGDVVLFARYSGQDFEDRHRILSFNDLLGKLIQ